ncbi:MAG: AmmeMemoRadiSam system protein B [Deltaproteobacteria bacterium]|nr:AmmeMemoRadiSam system protein B [Deltaproteobacteria bacterium]
MADRHPVVAGRFYPGDPVQLRQTVESFLGVGREEIAPLMVMLPHAGYMYCGSIIGETLRKLRLPQSVFLLGPNHSGRGKPLSIWPEGKWLTPLGAVEVDADLATRCLEADAGFEANLDAHAMEHSLEVLLPFLQCRAPGIRIVPVAVALNKLEGPRAAGEAIARRIREERKAGREVAMVVSSDMNHFDDQEVTAQKDAKALAPLLKLLPEELFNTVRAEGVSMCGVFPATLALFAVRELGASEAKLEAYGTSAAASGDLDRVVGYAGAYVW